MRVACRIDPFPHANAAEIPFVVPENEDEPVPVTSMEQMRDLPEQHVHHELEEDPASA
ncbi:hypothetical protein ACWDBO_30050 [Streptomyces mirabilis]|uniref:hypothetical protein n=1 Tax=Streptomyces mirabilis TaxID=68239 RepID=UPI00331823FA